MKAQRKGLEIKEVREHRSWFKGFGIVMIMFGLAAVGSSIVGAVVSLGWLLLLAGACQLAHGLVRWRWSGLLLNLPSGILSFLTGFLIVCDPAIDVLIRSRLLATFLVIIGVVRLFVALSVPLAHHGWLMFHAVIAILSGCWIWNFSSGSVFWMIGFLVGLNMMIEGGTEITLARLT
jgi:uncharacterized membrane protein HdeD (DUF308 family)